MRHPTNRRQGHPRLKEKQRIQRTPHDNKPKIQDSITNRNPLTSTLNATQNKSCLHTNDCIEAMLLGLEKKPSRNLQHRLRRPNRSQNHSRNSHRRNAAQKRQIQIHGRGRRRKRLERRRQKHALRHRQTQNTRMETQTQHPTNHKKATKHTITKSLSN